MLGHMDSPCSVKKIALPTTSVLRQAAMAKALQQLCPLSPVDVPTPIHTP